MMEQGLVNEAEPLFEYNHLNALQTVGYKEIFDYFYGTVSLKEATALITVHTRQYAKRQRTWFARVAQAIPIAPGATMQAIELINKKLLTLQ
jgi:tRNA dimethylallyltransferase